ncbi:MAG: VWA domain-containing protein [Acidobacteria bacterium]|nr:VWA domain-containing protein [Acidobacteriota bacterium]
MITRSQKRGRTAAYWKRSWLTGLVLSLMGALAPPLGGQQEPTFSTDVNVVNVLATVRNKQGQIISNLTKDDFMLQEDGRPQTIRYFTKESDLALTLGLLVDTSLSQARLLDEERSASYAFLDEVLREDKDLAFVIHFDREVELLQDLTSSRQKLQAALELLRTPPQEQWPPSGGGMPGRGPRGGPGPWPGGQPVPWPWPLPGPFPDPGPGGGGSRRGGLSGGTNLYDAVYLASNELMRNQPGRKALVMLSDGVDTGSQESLMTAIEAAERADTLVYSILFVDEEMYQSAGGRYPPTGMPNGRAILERISRSTGGRLFEVSRKQSLVQIYATLQEELRNQYSIGYSPERSGADTGYHRIRLVAKPKGLVVQTRAGYYSQP